MTARTWITLLSSSKSPTRDKKSGFLAILQIFDNILSLMRHSVNWLAGFFQMTEEEQENAGVYLGRLGDQ